MFTPPGSNDLAGELKALQRRIDELGRRSNPVHVCTGWDTGGTTTLVSENFIWLPGTWLQVYDPSDMVRTAESGDLWVQLPHPGRWHIAWTTVWLAAQNYNASFPNIVASIVYLNGASYSSPGTNIGEKTEFHNPTGVTVCRVVVEDRLFSAGDKIRFASFSRYANARMISQHLSSSTRTHFVVRYLGPN